MITFFFKSNIHTTFGKLILFVDIISLIGGIIAYNKNMYKILLFFIFFSVLFQYLGLIFI